MDNVSTVEIESVLDELRRFEPSEEFKAQANIKDSDYKELLEKAQKDPNGFWSDLAARELSWLDENGKQIEADFSGAKVCNDSKAPFFKWFENFGLKTNISFNCIDRHLAVNGGNRDEKLALVWEGEPGDKRELSYKELHTEVCKFANALKELGIKKTDVVTIYMPLMPEAIVAMHACNRIGAIHSVVFGGFSSEALKDRIVDGKSKLVITADGLFRKGNVVPLAKSVEEAVANVDHELDVISLRRVADKRGDFSQRPCQNKSGKREEAKNFYDWQTLVSKQSGDCDPVPLDPTDISFILYTSGSTGKPKGIQHGTAGYLLWTHLTSKWVFDLKEDDIYWCTADVGWITGHSYVAYGPLSNGATTFLYEGAPNHPASDRFWDLIEKYKVSVFYTAPTAIRAFNQWGEEHITKHDLSSLRLLGTVGEPINPESWVWYYEKIGQSRCPVVDTWWQTETGGIMITTLPGVHTMIPGTAGKPLPGIDADVNAEGLLVVKSPWASMLQTIYGDDERYVKTYWRSNDAKDEFKDGEPCFYAPGDGAHKNEDGYIEIMGRVDDVINVSGHRLGTAEVESALVSHEKISEAAIVAIPHEIKGEGIVAYVVLKGSESTSENLEEEFKKHVDKQIGAIARPEKIVISSGLPKTRSGKIMRRLLRDLAQGKKPSGDISTIENTAVLDELMKG